jgi:hypothetical protein
VVLPGPGLMVGPLDLFMILDCSGPAPRIAEKGVYHSYIWQEVV